MNSCCLIVTDMDGTLLNHHDYSYRAVLPMMRELEQAGIPVVLNTSKTLAELLSWIEHLGNRHPFIVENGSAIYIPEDYEPFMAQLESESGIERQGAYRVITTGAPIELLRVFKRAWNPDALDLTECSLETAMVITGLGEREAREAQDRQYSLPLQFADSRQEKEYVQAAMQAGFGILRGGRFLHHMGATDKGQSMLRLKRLYERVYDCPCWTIALGDSPNDQAMLEAADVAVVVASPSSERLNPQHSKLLRTQQSAPDGWVEGVAKALELLSITL